MTTLLVLGGLLLLLVVACAWESRSGRPEWGTRRGPDDLGVGGAAGAGKLGAAASAATLSMVVGMDAGGDG